MSPEELQQRQLQIDRLHKRIREYKLTSAEQKELLRSKTEQNRIIQSKFEASKVNEGYRFPKSVQDQDSPCLGTLDVVDLFQMNETSVIRKSNSNHSAFITRRTTRQNQPAHIYSSITDHSLRRQTSLWRQSLSPGRNRTFESRKSVQRKTEPKQLNSVTKDKSYNLRLLTDTNYLNKTKSPNCLQNQDTSCKNTKQVVKLKNSLNHTRSKVGLNLCKKGVQPIKSGVFTKYKDILGKSGKENQLRSRCSTSKNQYQSGTLKTQHSRNFKDQSKSFYQTSTHFQKPSPNPRTLPNKQGSYFNSKWAVKTCFQDQSKLSMRNSSQEDETTIKKRSYKRSNFNQTISGNLKSRPIQHKSHNGYYSNVFQSVKPKNNPSDSESFARESSSRVAIGISSPLSSKYLQYRPTNTMTFTNR